MNSTAPHKPFAKSLVGISGLLGLALAAGAGAQEKSPEIMPIESLWAAPMPPLTTVATGDVAEAKIKILKKWQQAKVFDAVLVLDLPPTFVDHQGSTKRGNAIIKDIGGPFIIATLPVGKEGWESSNNERFAKKATALGTKYDASKAMSQAQWLQTMKDLKGDTWAWVMEHGARMPTPEQAARSASEFVRVAKAEHKKPVIWLSVEALTHGKQTEELMKHICAATQADADAFVWMDMPAESLKKGEAKWRETMDQVLDKVLKLSPKEKTVIQWLNHPQWPTKDVAGTKAYISLCQAKGINRFCVLVNPQSLEREPWTDFYRTLPRKEESSAKKSGAKK